VGHYNNVDFLQYTENDPSVEVILRFVLVGLKTDHQESNPALAEVTK
jgi:hypothetical protein